MKVKFNQWYLFKSSELRDAFIREAIVNNVSYNIEKNDKYHNADLLMVSDKCDKLYLKYLMDYNPAYIENPISFTKDMLGHQSVMPADIQFDNSGTIKLPNKLTNEITKRMYEDTKYCNNVLRGDANMKLIDNARNDELTKINKEYEDARIEMIFTKSEVGKIFASIGPKLDKLIANKVFANIDVKSMLIDKFYIEQFLTEEEVKYLQKFAELRDNAVHKLNKRYVEINEIYNLAETYEQKIGVLTRYGIIDEVK